MHERLTVSQSVARCQQSKWMVKATLIILYGDLFPFAESDAETMDYSSLPPPCYQPGSPHMVHV